MEFGDHEFESEDDFDEDKFIHGRSTSSFYPSNHNTSPITLFPQQHMVKYFETRNKDLLKAFPVDNGVKLIKEHIQSGNFSADTVVTDDASPIYYFFLSESTAPAPIRVESPKELTDINMCFTAGLRCIETELRGLVNHHPAIDRAILGHVTSLANNTNQFCPVLNGYVIRDRLEDFKQDLQLLMVTRSPNKITLSIGPLRLLANQSLIIGWFVGDEITLMLLNYDQFVMLLDTVIARTCTLTACLINDKTSQRLMPSLEELLQVYAWGDHLVKVSGYNAYAAIGEFESLLTCRLIRFGDSDSLSLGEEYEQSIYDSEKEMEKNYGVPVGWVASLFSLLKDVRTINKLSEVFGIRKHWGNPVLDAQASGEAVQDKAQEKYPIDPDAMVALLASFQRMIILEFIRKEGKWPECVVLDGYEKTPLAEAFRRKSLRINESHKDHKFLDWAGIKFLKNVSIDKCLNPLDLLSDKSCSLYRPNLDSIYVKGYRTDDQKGKPRPEESRRLLLEYMRRDHLSIEEIFTVIQTETTPDDWLVNLCALKGTEMKHEKGRIFAVLPYELRQYFSGTEDLIKRYIFPYNPHQTMTMKEDQLIRLLAEITGQLNPDSESRELHVIHIIDFSKWNLRMSEENTSLIFNSIDNFLGTPNLIEATHYLFDKMLNVVQDAFNPPEGGVSQTFSKTIWNMHNRGWEGQRQRGWTGLTSALLAVVEYRTGVHSKILGQGDNQLLASRFRIPDEYKNAADWIARDKEGVKKRLDDFYNVLIEECLKIGLPVKKSETCRSLVFCNYGKRLYQYGVELSMELKRVSRIATESNDTFPTTDSLLKTMTSSAAASPIFGPPSITSLLVSHINVAITLKRAITSNPLVKNEMKSNFALLNCQLTSDLLTKMMWIPASLGGPHRTMLINSLYRGHPDPIAGDFANATLAARSGSSFHKKLLNYIAGLEMPSTGVDLKGLVASPYSINLKTPYSPLQPLLSAVKSQLSMYCKNSDIKPLFSQVCDKQELTIIEALRGLEPFHPVIANEIYSRSLPGRRESFLSGFQNTTSFSQLLGYTGNALRIKVGRYEGEQVLWWVTTALNINKLRYKQDQPIELHHIILQKLRERTWGRELEGVTVPHPSEAIKLVSSNFGLCTEECQGLSNDRIDLVLLDDDRVGIDTDGERTRLTERIPNRMGYLGNKVSEGMICKTLKATNHSTALEDAMRLNVIRRWITEPESALDYFIRDLISQRTDLSLDELNELTGIPVRLSYTHRVASIATKKKCSVACNTNIHSQIYISSNNMGELNRTDENFSFVFGQSFLMCQHLIGYNEFYGSQNNYRKKICYHGHVLNTDSIPSVYDGSISMTTVVKRKEVFRRPACKLLYIERRFLELDIRGNRVSPTWWETPGRASIEFARLAYGVQIVGDTFIQAERIKSLLNVQGSSISNKREAPITAGDVLGIGVRSYLKAISQCLLLHLPFDVIFNQIRSDHSSCSLTMFVDKVGSETWPHLFSPLLVPKAIGVLMAILPKYRSATFGTTLGSIINPLQTIVVNNVGRLLMNQQRLLLQSRRDGNMVLSDIAIFSDGPKSTRYLAARYIELNLAILFAVVSPQPAITGILIARKSIRELHDLPLVDDYSNLLMALRSSFVSSQKQLFEKSSNTKYAILPTPRFADLNSCWGAVVQQHKLTVGNRPEVLKTDVRKLEVMPKLSKKFDYVGADRMINCVELRCNCFNFVPCIPIPIERMFMPYGVSSKDHYSIIEAIDVLGLPILGVASIGYPAASELRVIASSEGNERVYTNPLLPLTSFSEHTAGSYTPGEFFNCPFVGKLVLPSEAVLSNETQEEHTYLNLRSTREHLKGQAWTGIILRLQNMDPFNFHKDLIMKTLRDFVNLGYDSTTRDGWVMIQLTYPCIHLVECILTTVTSCFTHASIIPSIYNSYPSGILTISGYKKRYITQCLDLTYSMDYISVLSLDQSNELHRFLATIVRSMGIPPIANAQSRRESLKLFQGKLENGLESAWIRYIGNNVIMKAKDKAEILELLQKFLVDCLASTDMIKNFSDRLFYGKPMCSNMVLALSSQDEQGQENENGYLYARVSLLISLLEDISDLTVDSIIIQVLSKFTRSIIISGVDSTHYSHDLRPKISLSHFLKYYAGDLFEIVGYFLTNKLKKKVFRSFLPDLHFQGTIPKITGVKIFQEMSIFSFGNTHINLSFMWPRKSTILMLMYVKFLLNPNKVIVFSSSDRWLSKVCEVLGIEYHISIVTLISVASIDTVVIPIGQASIDSCLKQLVHVFSRMFFLTSRYSTDLLVDKGLCSVLRPPYLGVVPEDCWVELKPNGSHQDRALPGEDWSATSNIWTISNRGLCRCLDCASTEFIINQSEGFNNSVVNMLASNDNYIEGDFDLWH